MAKVFNWIVIIFRGSDCEEIITRQLFDLAATDYGTNMTVLNLGGDYMGNRGSSCSSINVIAVVINSSLDRPFLEGCDESDITRIYAIQDHHQLKGPQTPEQHVLLVLLYQRPCLRQVLIPIVSGSTSPSVFTFCSCFFLYPSCDGVCS